MYHCVDVSSFHHKNNIVDGGTALKIRAFVCVFFMCVSHVLVILFWVYICDKHYQVFCHLNIE